MAEQKIETADGLRWLMRKGTDDHLGPHPHESSLEPILTALLPTDGTFLDVGAHVGHWSLRLATRAGRVIAIECNPDTLWALGVNIGLNGFDHIEVVPLAASDTTGDRIELWDPNGLVAGGSLTSRPSEASGEKRVTATTTRIDDLDLTPNLVKIDVEGAEVRVLWGMQATIEAHRPVMVIEMHHRLYPDAGIAEDVTKLLDHWHYDHRRIYALGEAEYWLARPQESLE